MSASRTYNSPAREAKAAATRHAILEAFRDQLLEPGRDSLSPKEAAEVAGCSVRTVHGHFPTGESRVEALAELLDTEFYTDGPPLPTSADDLTEHYRTIHRAALASPLAEALVTQPGEFRRVRSHRRADRIKAVRRVVAGIGAPAAPTDNATAVLLALAGAEVAIHMRDEAGLDAAHIPDAIADTVELIVADLRRTAGEAGGGR